VLQCVTACCSGGVLRRIAVCCGVIRCVVVCYSVLQYVAVYCNLQLCETEGQACVALFVRVRVCVFVCVCVCMRVYVFMRVCVSMCVHTCKFWELIFAPRRSTC